MTTEEKHDALRQVLFEIGLRDYLIDTAEREKRVLLDQYRKIQETPDAPAEKEPAHG
jgi:hypothetical protein